MIKRIECKAIFHWTEFYFILLWGLKETFFPSLQQPLMALEFETDLENHLRWNSIGQNPTLAQYSNEN